MTCNSIYNLLSCCGLVDAKLRASDKDLPVEDFYDNNLEDYYIMKMIITDAKVLSE